MKRIWKKPDIDNYVSSLNNLDKKPNSDVSYNNVTLT